MPNILSVIDVCNATVGFIRPMREGEEVLNSGFVVSVGLKDRKESVVRIQALVLRTSGLQKHPYLVELWVDLDKDYGSRLVKDQSQECECKAGQSEKCKHVIAVMLYLARTDETELDDLSCTDVEQQWGALKATTLKEYEAKSLQELCRVKLPNNVYVLQMPTVTPEMEEKWANRLRRCAPSSEYSLFFSSIRGAGLTDFEDDHDTVQQNNIHDNVFQLMTFRSWRILRDLREITTRKKTKLSPELLCFYEQNVEVTLPESIKIAQAQQRTQTWYAARKNRITASSARSQYTYYSKANADWNKRYQTLYHSTFKGNNYTTDGLKYEVAARERYEALNNCQILETGIIVHPDIPWLGSSLDGTVMDENGGFLRNIEIKTLKEGKRLKATEFEAYNVLKTIDKNGNVKQAHDHYAQMQLGMLLSGVSECDYLLYSQIGSDYAKKRVQFNQAYVLDLVSRLAHVFFDIFLPMMMADNANVVEADDIANDNVSDDGE